MSDTVIRFWFLGLATLSFYMFKYSKIAGYKPLLLLTAGWMLLAVLHVIAEKASPIWLPFVVIIVIGTGLGVMWLLLKVVLYTKQHI